jgi:hypothetical protein
MHNWFPTGYSKQSRTFTLEQNLGTPLKHLVLAREFDLYLPNHVDPDWCATGSGCGELFFFATTLWLVLARDIIDKKYRNIRNLYHTGPCQYGQLMKVMKCITFGLRPRDLYSGFFFRTYSYRSFFDPHRALTISISSLSVTGVISLVRTVFLPIGLFLTAWHFGALYPVSFCRVDASRRAHRLGDDSLIRTSDKVIDQQGSGRLYRASSWFFGFRI